MLMLTKSADVDNLLRREGQRATIASFSVNPPSVAKKWEKGAPPPEERLAAAAKLAAAGYQVRLRIDPIVPVNNWKKEYNELLNQIFELFRPDRITLGSLRGLQSTINNARDKSWTEYLTEKSPWGRRIDSGVREEAFAYILQRLRSTWGYSAVGLCKEPISTWQALGLDYTQIRCNCTS